MRTTATRQRQSIECVYEVEVRVAVLVTGLGMQEEDEGARAQGVLARPVTCQGALTACLAGFLACLGTRVPANGVQGSSQGWYQRRPCVLGVLCDMVKVRGGGQREEWHGWPAWCTTWLV